jgi:hydroxymethylpyrimidine pyrophosphatase-like HAD family hydrolase
MNPLPPILALASDYDSTLAFEGKIAPHTRDALARLKASTRKLLLVTGRELDDLLAIAPEIELFDCTVAENGAVLYWPSRRHIESLAPPPPNQFLEKLRQRGVHPLSVGRSIAATTQPHAGTVQETITEMGLALEVIFNRDSVMVLPAGVNKATGLARALRELGVPPAQVVGVGDAENDEALLNLCGFSVAVANAIPRIKQLADMTTEQEHGPGVVEVIEKILAGEGRLVCCTTSESRNHLR